MAWATAYLELLEARNSLEYADEVVGTEFRAVVDADFLGRRLQEETQGPRIKEAVLGKLPGDLVDDRRG